MSPLERRAWLQIWAMGLPYAIYFGVQLVHPEWFSQMNLLQRLSCFAAASLTHAVITVVGLLVALTLSGAVLTERTFNWPGLGFALVDYVTKRDYIAVQGIVTFFALVVVIVSLVVDILNALVDPRVRY